MDDEFDGRIAPRKFQKIDILLVGFNLLDEVFAAVSDAFTSLTALTAAHANYKIERAQFHDEATLEIETLTGEEDG